MKSILISIKPEWVAKILNGEKTIEIRKTMPKCDLPIDVYIYCTKGNKKHWHLIEVVDTDTGWEGYEYDYYISSKGYLKYCLEGKVVAKFTLNQVERFDVPYPAYFSQVEKGLKHITDNSCLTLMELHHYLKNETGYAWYIDNLVIFNKPKGLSEFFKWCEPFELNKGCRKVRWEKTLTKAPQSWCYIETEDK